MDGTNVITLEEAKEFLKVDFDNDDLIITNLIKAAVGIIEKKTSYMLYERNEISFVSNCDKIYKYPFSLSESEDNDNYTIIANRLYSSINIIGGIEYPTQGRGVELTLGYNDPSLIPSPLREACLRLITYWYDQREMQNHEFPSDVYMLIQPFIRDFTI